jgi:hypothetical protein
LTRPLDKHLDSDELEGLVSSHPASVPDSGQLPEYTLEETRRHVESCLDCSQKVQMHKSVQSRILSMGAPSNVPRGPDCADETEWLNVAAGLLPEANTRELMRHAARCGHCGPLLRSAASILSDDVSAKEESELISLRRTEDLKGLTEELRLSQVARIRDSKQGDWRRNRVRPSWLEKLVPTTLFDSLMLQRLAVGTIFALATAALCWLLVQNRHLSVELAKVRTDGTAAAVKLAQEQDFQKQQTAQLKARTGAQDTSPESSHILQFALEPGLARDVGGETRLQVSPFTQVVELTLKSPERPDGVLREELLGSDGRMLWSQEAPASTRERETSSIVILLPAQVFSADDYRIKLKRRSDTGTIELISTYAFRVNR